MSTSAQIDSSQMNGNSGGDNQQKVVQQELDQQVAGAGSTAFSKLSTAKLEEDQPTDQTTTTAATSAAATATTTTTATAATNNTTTSSSITTPFNNNQQVPDGGSNHHPHNNPSSPPQTTMFNSPEAAAAAGVKDQLPSPPRPTSPLSKNRQQIINSLQQSSMTGGPGIIPKSTVLNNPVSSTHQQPTTANIIDVYADNLYEEFIQIRKTVKKYKYVAMDTEFPGVVAIPEKKTKYQQIRVNVDLLNIIQLGIAFMDENGQMDSEACCWQFNFKFSTEIDMYAEDSINLLKEAGIPFKTLEEKGIDRQTFAELFITSGICLNNKVNWITFHAGYDFAYMLKLMRNDAQLPDSEEKFFELLKLYFPAIYDIKYMLKSCKVHEGGLEAIANELDVGRIGGAHTAGSDAILTGQTYFKIREKYSCEVGNLLGTNDDKYRGIIYGIGSGSVPATYHNNPFPDRHDRRVYPPRQSSTPHNESSYKTTGSDGVLQFQSPNRNHTATPPADSRVKHVLPIKRDPMDNPDNNNSKSLFFMRGSSGDRSKAGKPIAIVKDDKETTAAESTTGEAVVSGESPSTTKQQPTTTETETNNPSVTNASETNNNNNSDQQPPTESSVAPVGVNA